MEMLEVLRRGSTSRIQLEGPFFEETIYVTPDRLLPT